MRKGSNPDNHVKLNIKNYSHRVVIPVYIPNCEGFFKNSFEVLQVCLTSLLKTINSDTAITLISNASTQIVSEYLIQLYNQKKIDKVVFYDSNLGKVNAVFAELKACTENFVTISDYDVFFDQGWLKHTYQLFKDFPKAGFVSMNPMPASYGFSSSAIIDNIFYIHKHNEFIRDYCSYDDLEHFHRSIGRELNQTKKLYSQKALILKKNNSNCFIGAGHFCFTIKRKPLLDWSPSLIANSSGDEKKFIDLPFEKSGFWRISSTKAYIWHMGNVLENDWSIKKMNSIEHFIEDDFSFESLKKEVFIFSKAIPFWIKIKIISILKKIKKI